MTMHCRPGQPSAGSPSAERLSCDEPGIDGALRRKSGFPGPMRSRVRPRWRPIAQSADGLVRQGFRLAERGAVYSARLKFFAALSLIARSLDVEQQTQVYSRSLVAGRTALVEAWDFRASGLPMATDMARIVAAHRTPVLAQVPLESLSPVSAQQRYFTYAQEQLALAAGREPVGSLALYGLGKTAAAVHGPADAPNLTIAGEQMACYQAALMVDDRNFRAAHELGVLLADARPIGGRSRSVSAQPGHLGKRRPRGAICRSFGGDWVTTSNRPKLAAGPIN